jgi:thiol:disulfide interchange protein
VSLKYKLFILAVVAAAILAVLFLPGSALFSGVETVSDETVPDQFSPADEPYRMFIEARQAGKPVFLEFYARW